MRNIHYFYPENDLALALNSDNYTAPKAAVALRKAGQVLGMWMGNAGDAFVCDGVNAQWYDAVCNAFDIDIRPFKEFEPDMKARPWGWSKPVIKTLTRNGIDVGAMGDEEVFERYRRASSHAEAIGLAAFLRSNGLPVAGGGCEVRRLQDVMPAVTRYGRAMLKLPWSSSGRGVVDAQTIPTAEVLRRAAGTIARQGSVIVQPHYGNGIDFGMLFEIEPRGTRYLGLSVFENDSHQAYAGSLLGNEDMLSKKLLSGYAAVKGDCAKVDFNLLGQKIARYLDRFAGFYAGPASVDMMLIAGGAEIYGICEINLRHTMGRLAHDFARKHLGCGVKAVMRIRPSTRRQFDCEVFYGGMQIADSRLVSGHLNLLQPQSAYAITVTAEL